MSPQGELPLFPQRARRRNKTAAGFREEGEAMYDIITASISTAMRKAKDEAMATPGTITAGELREKHLGGEYYVWLHISIFGHKIHLAHIHASCEVSWRCNPYTYHNGGTWIRRKDTEIKHSRLCRHCFRELFKSLRR